jgi:hypothetical protein
MMLGDVEDELQAKIDEMDAVNTANKKMINTSEVRK